MDPIVKVTAHNNIIIIDGATDLEHPDWFPFAPGRVVVADTAKHLAISEEALRLLEKIHVGNDGLGDVDWIACDDGRKMFMWLGGVKRFINPDTSDGSRDYKVYRDACVIIPNESDPEAIKAIDEWEPPR